MTRKLKRKVLVQCCVMRYDAMWHRAKTMFCDTIQSNRPKTDSLFVGFLCVFLASFLPSPPRLGLMQAFSTTNQTTDYTTLVNNLGAYFQIRDDFINLVDEEYMKSKSFCEDLTEGKLSFPVIHSIRSSPDDNRLLSILKQKTEDTEVKRYAQRIMVESGSFDYTRSKLNDLRVEITKEIETLGGNPALTKLMAVLEGQIRTSIDQTGDETK